MLTASKAAHLIDSGVEVNVIRGWMGHASLVTTKRYAEKKSLLYEHLWDFLPCPIQPYTERRAVTTFSVISYGAWARCLRHPCKARGSRFEIGYRTRGSAPSSAVRSNRGAASRHRFTRCVTRYASVPPSARSLRSSGRGMQTNSTSSSSAVTRATE